MYGSPRGGIHEDCLHCLRPQGTHQFAGGNHPGLREAILPMPERNVWAYLGLRTDVQTHTSPPCPATGYAPGRTHQEPACRSAAEVAAATGTTARGLTQKPCVSQGRNHGERDSQVPASLACCCHSKAQHINACSAGILAACSIAGDARGLGAATPAQRPIAGQPLPQTFGGAAGPCPRAQPAKFTSRLGAPDYRFLLALVIRHGVQDLQRWVQGTALPGCGRAARDMVKN